jgi:capsule polysaccharide export protein KpsE/RkpR
MSSSYVEPPVRPLIREQMSFLAVINFVLRNLGLMLVIGALVSAFLVYRVVREPQTYTSTSTFSIGDFGGGARITQILGGGSSVSSAGATYITEIMTQPVFLEPLTLRELDFPTGRASSVAYFGGKQQGPEAIESAMGALNAKIHTSISTTTGWISLSTSAETGKLAEQLNYTVLAQLDSFQASQRRKRSVEDQKFAEERLAELGARLTAAQRKLQIFQETNRFGDAAPGLRLEEQRLRDSVSTASSLYTTILNTYERERIDAVRQTRLLTLISAPSRPRSPDKRPFARTIILGLFAGAFLGAVLGIIREYFRRIQAEDTPEAAEFIRLRDKWLGWIPLRLRERLTG